MSQYDGEVAVVGAGTMGSMVLWRLARRGIRAVGFEKMWPGHDQGAAGGETRMFRTAYFEGSEYIPLLRSARRIWRQLESETLSEILTLNGGLVIGGSTSTAMRQLVGSISDHRLKGRVLTGTQASTKFPQHNFDADDLIFEDRAAGFMRSQLAIIAASRRAQELGAHVEHDSPVQEVHVSADGVVVRVRGRRYHFEKLVLAAGPWTGQLMPMLAPLIQVRRIVSTWFAARDPAMFAPSRCPIFLRHAQGTSLGGFKYLGGYPSMDGFSVKVSGIVHDAVAEPDALNKTVDPSALLSLRKAIAHYLPSLHPDPVRVSAYMDGYTKDGHGLLGFLPQAPRVLLLAGFSGHGFKLSPVFGDAAADLITLGETGHLIARLAPSRFFSYGRATHNRATGQGSRPMAQPFLKP